MALLTVEGVFRDTTVELAESPPGLRGEVRVLVTFLPSDAETGLCDETSHDRQRGGDPAAGKMHGRRGAPGRASLPEARGFL
jgi:hypothetical protein